MKKTSVKTRTKKRSDSEEKEQPANVLLRLKSESEETISAHANMIARKGVALLGKLGRVGLSPAFTNASQPAN
jgi:hypothetical protein